MQQVARKVARTVVEQSITAAPRWRATLIACVVTFLALLALFWPTVQGMAYIWYNFETYTHGFLILPITPRPRSSVLRRHGLLAGSACT